jgi:predicted GNAT family acetyltransferase
MAAPKKVDYGLLEPAWRAGVKSPNQMAAEYKAATGVSVSHTAIVKHFKKLGIPRDLKAKVMEKAEAMVLAATVSGKVSAETTERDAEIINTNATLVAEVRIAHRSDIARARRLCMGLLTELEAQTADVPALAHLGEILRKEDEKGVDRLNDAYRAIISLPERTKTMKALADSLKVVVSMEREALGMKSMDDNPPPAPPDLSAIPPEQRQDAYLRLVSGL